MMRLKLYQAEAQQLISALRQHGSAIQQATLWQRFPSPLGINFWSGLAGAFRQDSTHLHELAQQTVALTGVAFSGSRVFITLGGIAGTALLMAMWLCCHGPVRRLVSRFVPFGRLRPITATLACAAIATAAWGFSCQILWNILSFDNPAAQGDLAVLADMVATQAPLCGFVLELAGACFPARRNGGFSPYPTNWPETCACSLHGWPGPCLCAARCVTWIPIAAYPCFPCS